MEVSMKTLVKFSTINNVQPLDNLFTYVENVVIELLENGLITKVIIGQTTLDFGDSSPIDEIADNVFAVEFVYSKENINTHWQLVFEFGTFSSSKQLEITISSDDYIIETSNNYLEQLKLAIKKSIKDDWKEIVWLMDKDSEMLSIELYPSIYRVENLARQLINEIMTKEYGIEWWEVYVPIYIKKKHRARMSGYKSTVPGFTNVNERLMSIDIGDLISIFTLKEKKWVPVFDGEINHFLNGHSEMKLEKVREKLVEQMETTRDLWTEQFSKYLSNDFIEYLKEFELNRNHVVHNKLIDRTAYISILRSIQKVEKELKDGLHKVSETVISTEQRKAIAEQVEMERKEQEAALYDIMESEAGVKIRSVEEIIELYDEHLYEFYTEFQSNLRFRNDIEIGDYQNISSSEDTGVLFEVKYKIDDETAEVSYGLESIIDLQGEESTVNISIRIGNENYSKSVRYINGEVSFNSYQGNYMPETQDEFSMLDLEELMEGLVEFIDEHFENKREKIDSEMYSIIKDGGSSPVADISCWGCGEEYICIDENYGVFGQCLSCGEMINISVCDRCGCHFEGEPSEDELNFCENCLDHFENE